MVEIKVGLEHDPDPVSNTFCRWIIENQEVLVVAPLSLLGTSLKIMLGGGPGSP